MKLKFLIIVSTLTALFSAVSFANTYGCVQFTNNSNSVVSISLNSVSYIYQYGIVSPAMLPGESATIFLSAYDSHKHSTATFSVNYAGAGNYPSQTVVLSVNSGDIGFNSTPSVTPLKFINPGNGSGVSGNACVQSPPGVSDAKTYAFTIKNP